jgi:hypothetical protein
LNPETAAGVGTSPAEIEAAEKSINAPALINLKK